MAAAVLEGGAPDAFDQRERARAGVFTDGVAQDPPKQANVLAQRLILVCSVLCGGALAHGENLACRPAIVPKTRVLRVATYAPLLRKTKNLCRG